MLNRHLIAASLLLAPHIAHSVEFFAGANLANMTHKGGGFSDYECPPVFLGTEYGVRDIWSYCLMDYDSETSYLSYARFGARFNEHIRGELRMGRSENVSGTHISCDDNTPDSNIRDLIEEHSPFQRGSHYHCFKLNADLGSIFFGGAYVQLRLPVRSWMQPYMTLGLAAYRLNIDYFFFSVIGDHTMANLAKPLEKVGYDFTYGIGFDAPIKDPEDIVFNMEYSVNNSFGTFSLGLTHTLRKKP